MDILRLAVTSLIAGTLILSGCDNQSTSTKSQKDQLLVKAKEGLHNKYWIQGYSMITQNNQVDWSTKESIGISLLADYQVLTASNKEIKLNVSAKYTELQVRGLAAYPSKAVQTILNKGMLYQFNLGSNQPQTIAIQDKELQQTIGATVALKQEYQYLQFIIAPPFIPEAIPLSKDQQITIEHFMGLNKVTLRVNEITYDKLIATLSSTEQANKLYGKVVINKITGWVEKMALVKDTQFAGANDQSMRTILLMGPTTWSNNEQHQLITDIKNDNLQQSSAIIGLDKKIWEEQQQQESAFTPKEGELFVLNTPNTAKQLMLMLANSAGTNSKILGQYKIEEAAIEKQAGIELLPTANMSLNTTVNDSINIATYKPLLNQVTDNDKLAAIKTISAKVSFIPYQLETLILPISDKKEQSIQEANNDFSISITPTNRPETYLISWQNKENIKFDIQLINGAKNATIQLIQPDTAAWLTPSESRIVNNINNSEPTRAQITFTGEVPKSLEINLLKQGNKAAYTYPILFK